MGHHQAAPMVALAKPKVLVEENFMQLKKDPEVVSEENRRLGEMLREVASNGESAVAASELIRRNLAEQMAMTLTRDPSFKAALVSALSGRILELSPTRDIN
ncbi:unnamed protein product [Triticum turgidum subsp. durum]|uniref:Uncharacterized protein n=1 Tax=Triticum turgidum subsp. durum TaxID=4567 RepID=A0A9R1AY46_TRITD|nr:unnamed protein product [Triticum turgidum subsp. durum]